VKVQYRRYAQDEAVELRRILNGVDMEKLVPISAHIVESVWHYQDGSGISMFKDGAVPGKDITVAPFNWGSAERYLKVRCFFFLLKLKQYYTLCNVGVG